MRHQRRRRGGMRTGHPVRTACVSGRPHRKPRPVICVHDCRGTGHVTEVRGNNVKPTPSPKAMDTAVPQMAPPSYPCSSQAPLPTSARPPSATFASEAANSPDANSSLTTRSGSTGARFVDRVAEPCPAGIGQVRGRAEAALRSPVRSCGIRDDHRCASSSQKARLCSASRSNGPIRRRSRPCTYGVVSAGSTRGHAGRPGRLGLPVAAKRTQ